MRTQNNKLKPVNLNNSHILNFKTFVESEEVKPYLLTIRKFPPFTREEEIAAVEKARSGKKSDVDNFINHNLLLVLASARHFMHNGVSLADLIQYGNIGLVTAANAYINHDDYYKKNRFNTYAVWYIRKYITEGIEEFQVIARPHMVYINANKVKNAVEQMSNSDSDIIIDVETIAQTLGLSVDDVNTAIRSNSNIVSMNSCLSQTKDGNNEEKKVELSETIMGDSFADTGLIKEDNEKMVATLLGKLTPLHQKIIKMKFGIGYPTEYTLDNIADELNRTKESVRQHMCKAMDKMKKLAESMEF